MEPGNSVLARLRIAHSAPWNMTARSRRGSALFGCPGDDMHDYRRKKGTRPIRGTVSSCEASRRYFLTAG
jgi:hypothetical protein